MRPFNPLSRHSSGTPGTTGHGVLWPWVSLGLILSARGSPVTHSVPTLEVPISLKAQQMELDELQRQHRDPGNMAAEAKVCGSGSVCLPVAWTSSRLLGKAWFLEHCSVSYLACLFYTGMTGREKVLHISLYPLIRFNSHLNFRSKICSTYNLHPFLLDYQ